MSVGGGGCLFAAPAGRQAAAGRGRGCSWGRWQRFLRTVAIGISGPSDPPVAAVLPRWPVPWPWPVPFLGCWPGRAALPQAQPGRSAARPTPEAGARGGQPLAALGGGRVLTLVINPYFLKVRFASLCNVGYTFAARCGDAAFWPPVPIWSSVGVPGSSPAKRLGLGGGHDWRGHCRAG